METRNGGKKSFNSRGKLIKCEFQLFGVYLDVSVDVQNVQRHENIVQTTIFRESECIAPPIVIIDRVRLLPPVSPLPIQFQMLLFLFFCHVNCFSCNLVPSLVLSYGDLVHSPNFE